MIPRPALSFLALLALSAPALAQTMPNPANTLAQGGKLVARATPDQWQASKLSGVKIYGPDESEIGSVKDVVLARNGQALAVVVSTGGVLGVGAKDIGIPFSVIQWSDQPRETGTMSRNVSSSSLATKPANANAPGENQSTAAGTGTGGDQGPTNAPKFYPDHGNVSLTKADVQNAPAFEYSAGVK